MLLLLLMVLVVVEVVHLLLLRQKQKPKKKTGPGSHRRQTNLESIDGRIKKNDRSTEESETETKRKPTA